MRAGIVDLPDEYPWSSYREYIDHQGAGLVDVIETLSHFSEDRRTAARKYKKFVETGIGDHDSPFQHVQAGIVLGGESFVEEKTQEIIREKGVDRELPALKRLFDGPSIEKVVEMVAVHYSLSPRDLTKRSRKHSRERKMAVYISKIMTGARHLLVGEYFGISPQGVANVLTEVENDLVESEETRKEVEGIKCRL